MDQPITPETNQQLAQEEEDTNSATNQYMINVANSLNSAGPPQPFSLASVLSCLVLDDDTQTQNPTSLITSASTPSPYTRSIAVQPRLLSSAPSTLDTNNQPQPLFLQALSKLNQSTLSIVVNKINSTFVTDVLRNTRLNQVTAKSPELSPPGSLMSAPPSYSSVLRQIAFRRRPRIVGTFIPSPSFVQHTPPPIYGAAFDVYLDNLPPAPVRMYNFGFSPTPVLCPDCGYSGLTIVSTKITVCTHLCAVILCLLCCWVCVPLPYILRSCKDVYHYCRNCRRFLGIYCPTNPDNPVP